MNRTGNITVLIMDSDWMDNGDISAKKLYREKVKKYFLRDSIQQAQAVFWLTQVIPANAIRRQHSESKSSKRFHFCT